MSAASRRSGFEQRAGDVPAEVRARLHLARAVALGPKLLLMEHPTAALPETDRVTFGGLVARVCEATRTDGAGDYAGYGVCRRGRAANLDARAGNRSARRGAAVVVETLGPRSQHDAGASNLEPSRGYFEMTPQATLGPPLTPDLARR